MDTAVRIFSGIAISKRKSGHSDWIFHADTDTMHRLVSGIHQDGERRPEIKSVNITYKSGIADCSASDLPDSVFFKQNHIGLLSNHLFTSNSYCNPIYSLTDYKIYIK